MRLSGTWRSGVQATTGQIRPRDASSLKETALKLGLKQKPGCLETKYRGPEAFYQNVMHYSA